MLARYMLEGHFCCLKRIFIFILVFVSRDFELGRNVSCEESTVSPALG